MSVSANKLGKLKAHAAIYASLIMEELDPDHNGYIEVSRDLLNFNPDRFEGHTIKEIPLTTCYLYF